MEVVCKNGRHIVDTAYKTVEVGVTTDELDLIVNEAAIKNYFFPSPLNYYKFQKSVYTSVNKVICHGIPDKKTLKNGDIVNLDVTVFHHGYHGDLNETYLLGSVDKKAKNLVKMIYISLMKVIDICKLDTKFSEIGGLIGEYVEEKVYIVVRSYTGHGICKLFLTASTICHYRKNKVHGVMKPGNIFTIEPIINEGSWNDVKWFDNWISATQDVKRSAQFEHTI